MPATHIVYSQEQAFLHITQKRSDKEQLLYMITDDILFNVWDALCLSIDQDSREEYIPYLPHVFDLLIATDDGLDLFDYLVTVEELNFNGFKDDALAKRRASRVVDLLLEHRNTIFSDEEKTFKNPNEGQQQKKEPYPA